MSVDRQAMCDTILNNGTIPASYYVAEKLAFNESGKDYREVAGKMGYEHNKEEATKLWEKAKEEVGFDTVTLELLSFDSESSKRTAEFMQSELQSALPGLTVEIKSQPFKQKLDLESKGDFDLSYASWNPDYPDPLTFLETMQPGIQYAKNTSYKNEEYNKLIEEAKNAGFTGNIIGYLDTESPFDLIEQQQYKTFAIEAEHLSVKRLREVEKAFSVETNVDIDQVLKDIRNVKTDNEIEMLQEAAKYDIDLCVIGGITAENIHQLRDYPLRYIAVVSDILQNPVEQVAKRCQQWQAELREKWH